MTNQEESEVPSARNAMQGNRLEQAERPPRLHGGVLNKVKVQRYDDYPT